MQSAPIPRNNAVRIVRENVCKSAVASAATTAYECTYGNGQKCAYLYCTHKKWVTNETRHVHSMFVGRLDALIRLVETFAGSFRKLCRPPRIEIAN